LLPGGTNQFPGGSDFRCGPSPSHGARDYAVYQALYDLMYDWARDPEALAAWYKQHLGVTLESAGGGYYPFGVSDLFLDDTRGLENFGGCSSAYS